MASFVLHCHFVSIPIPIPCSPLPCSPSCPCCLVVLRQKYYHYLQCCKMQTTAARCGGHARFCRRLCKLRHKVANENCWLATHTHTHRPTHRHTHSATQLWQQNAPQWGQSQLSDMRVAAIEKFSWLSIALEKWKWNGKWKWKCYAAALPRPTICYAILLSCWHPHCQFICHTKCIWEMLQKSQNVLHFLCIFSQFFFIILYFY